MTKITNRPNRRNRPTLTAAERAAAEQRALKREIKQRLNRRRDLSLELGEILIKIATLETEVSYYNRLRYQNESGLQPDRAGEERAMSKREEARLRLKAVEKELLTLAPPLRWLTLQEALISKR